VLKMLSQSVGRLASGLSPLTAMLIEQEVLLVSVNAVSEVSSRVAKSASCRDVSTGELLES